MPFDCQYYHRRRGANGPPATYEGWDPGRAVVHDTRHVVNFICSNCDAQLGLAIAMQVGTFASAYFTVAIGVHTFNSLVLSRRQSTLICVVTVSTGWIAAGIIGTWLERKFGVTEGIETAAAPTFQTLALGPRYGISGLSCGIKTVYPQSMFFFHLFPVRPVHVIETIVP